MTDMAPSSFFDPVDSPAAAEVVAALEEIADAELATGMASYMRNQFQFFGVATPPRRAACKHIVAQLRRTSSTPNWDFINALWEMPQRECQYIAVDYLRKYKLTARELDNVKNLVEAKSWWDTVDYLAKSAGTALVLETSSQADAAAARARMLEWAHSENMWTRRVALLCQLSFGNTTDTDLLSQVIESNLGAEAAFSTEFFITKAIGWALRDYARHNPEWVRDFVTTHGASSDLPLQKLSQREALKHL